MVLHGAMATVFGLIMSASIRKIEYLVGNFTMQQIVQVVQKGMVLQGAMATVFGPIMSASAK